MFPLYFSFFLSFFFPFFGVFRSSLISCEMQPRGFRAGGCSSPLMCIKSWFLIKGCFLINLQVYMKEEWVDPNLTVRLCGYVMLEVFIKTTGTVYVDTSGAVGQREPSGCWGGWNINFKLLVWFIKLTQLDNRLCLFWWKLKVFSTPIV